MSISDDYIAKFDLRYFKNTKYEMIIHGSVLAFKLLDNAKLEHQTKQLALTACASNEIQYKMKSALKRIFGGSRSPNSKNSISTGAIKQEQEVSSAVFTQDRKNKSFPNSRVKSRDKNQLNKYGEKKISLNSKYVDKN